MVIHRKRKLNSNKCGTAKRPTKILVAELTSAIYISRLNKCTTANDIKEHITERAISGLRVSNFGCFGSLLRELTAVIIQLIMDVKDSNITIISFNCKGLKRSVDQIREICKCADIIALQETWLWPHDLDFVSQIDPDFDSIAKSSMDTSVGVIRGRPHGGMALLWNKTKFAKVSVIECSSDRLQAVQITVGEVCQSMNISSQKSSNGIVWGVRNSSQMKSYFKYCEKKLSDMMKSIVIPVVKNKTGDLGSASNYRPISLGTVIGKVFERLLQPLLLKNVSIDDAQFGFRPARAGPGIPISREN
ncbi:reverse transcriptase [Operophtera brumata]|uniref:Reverse transcriptase n=1 Tax=Operophtera brumata TaxID=104452 RepID=A0A0L7LMU5_OPEBR|nr:reverse transcriptase [Operophtera brumata]